MRPNVYTPSNYSVQKILHTVFAWLKYGTLMLANPNILKDISVMIKMLNVHVKKTYLIRKLFALKVI